MTFRRTALTVLASLLILACGLAAQRSDSAQALLRAAIDTEVVAGDLNAAIKQYQAIVAQYGKTDRAIAARALIAMAECYRSSATRRHKRSGSGSSTIFLTRARLLARPVLAWRRFAARPLELSGLASWGRLPGGSLGMSAPWPLFSPDGMWPCGT